MCNWRVIVLWTIAWLINGIIVITADSLYVSLIINRSMKFEYLIQMTLALFKLLWHDIGLFQMIYQLKKNFTPTTTLTINREGWKPLHSLDENNNDDTNIVFVLANRNEEEEDRHGSLGLGLNWAGQRWREVVESDER